MSKKRKWVIEYYYKKLWGVEIEADNKEEAIAMFHRGDHDDPYMVGDIGDMDEIDTIYEVDENGDKV